MNVSIVIPTRNEGGSLLYTVKWILENNARPGLELIIVDDGSTDDSIKQLKDQYGESDLVSVIPGQQLGPGNARNFGGQNAQGDIIIFIDAHCYTPPGWLDGMITPLNDSTIGLVGCAFADLNYPERPGCLGVGCTWEESSLNLVWLEYQQSAMHTVPLLPGGCQAMRKSDFLSFGQYDYGMSHVGIEGEEQSLRCWLMGYSVVVQPSVVVHHLFREQPPYEIIAGELIYNRLRLAIMHFNAERAARVFDALKHVPDFSNQMIVLLNSDIMEQRDYWRERRVHSDNWYCEQFSLTV